MKFVRGKTLVQDARELNDLKNEIAAKREELRALVERHDELQAFLARKGDFQFAGDDGFVMQLTFNNRDMKVMNQSAVRILLAKLGKKVPMTTAEWLESKIDYVVD